MATGLTTKILGREFERIEQRRAQSEKLSGQRRSLALLQEFRATNVIQDAANNVRRLEQARSIAIHAGERYCEAAFTGLIAYCLVELGDTLAAAVYGERALEISVELRNPIAEVSSVGVLVTVYTTLGLEEQAHSHRLRMAELLKILDDKLFVASAANTLASSLRQTSQLEAARQFASLAVASSAGSNHPNRIALLETAADIELSLGNLSEAETLLDAACELNAELFGSKPNPRLLLALGRLAQKRRQANDAARLFARASDEFERTDVYNLATEAALHEMETPQSSISPQEYRERSRRLMRLRELERDHRRFREARALSILHDWRALAMGYRVAKAESLRAQLDLLDAKLRSTPPSIPNQRSPKTVTIVSAERLLPAIRDALGGLNGKPYALIVLNTSSTEVATQGIDGLVKLCHPNPTRVKAFAVTQQRVFFLLPGIGEKSGARLVERLLGHKPTTPIEAIGEGVLQSSNDASAVVCAVAANSPVRLPEVLHRAIGEANKLASGTNRRKSIIRFRRRS